MLYSNQISKSLYLKPKSTKADASAFGAYENTGINSLLVQSVFSQIRVYFIRKNDVVKHQKPSPYVYLKVLLSIGENCSNIQMQIQLNFLAQESVNDRTPKPEARRGLENVFTQLTRTFKLEDLKSWQSHYEDTCSLQLPDKRRQSDFPVRTFRFLSVLYASQVAVYDSNEQNPFNFQHFNLSEIVLNVNGESYSILHIKLDYQGNRYYATCLCYLYRASGRWCKDSSDNRERKF